MEVDHPEFRKLAFTSPGPKNAFAPLQRSCYGRQQSIAGGWDRMGEAIEPAATATRSKGIQVMYMYMYVRNPK